MEDDPTPVLVIDGSRFVDFAEEFTRLLTNYTWQGNLDAFNDILRGGFGTPPGGFTLRSEHSDLSRVRLGHEAMALRLEDVLTTCHSSGRSRVLEELDDALHGVGPTLFDLLVEIIELHGPGGFEADDNVRLELR